MATDISIFADTKLVDPTCDRACCIAQANRLRPIRTGTRSSSPRNVWSFHGFTPRTDGNVPFLGTFHAGSERFSATKCTVDYLDRNFSCGWASLCPSRLWRYIGRRHPLKCTIGCGGVGCSRDGYFFLSPPQALKSDPPEIKSIADDGHIPVRSRLAEHFSANSSKQALFRFSGDALEAARNRGARRATCPVLLRDVPLSRPKMTCFCVILNYLPSLNPSKQVGCQ